MLEVSTSDRQNLGLAALEYGIVEDRPVIVKQCIDDGVDVNEFAFLSGVRPLELAFEMRNVSTMRLLLERGVDIEGKNAQGLTTLIKASLNGCLKHVQLLVEYGASLYTPDSDGKTCLHFALEKKHYSLVTYLLRQDSCEGVARPIDGLCLLQHLILTDDAASISNLKHSEVDLNAACPDGTVLVFFALRYCKNNALKGLLHAGANPNIRSVDGYSALHEAARQNNIEAARLLIEHGADSHLKDKGGCSPVRMAIFLRSLSMLRLLLDSGANAEQDLGFFGTLLTYTCAMGYLEGVKLLVERGANLKACSPDGETSLQFAMEFKRYSIVDYLLNQDTSEVNEIGKDGVSALHRAVIMNNAGLMRKLIQKQANVNIQTHKGEVPVFVAVKRNAPKLLRMLLEAGADPNINTNDDDFALHEAVKQGNVKAVKLLLRHGADRDRADKNGVTPLEVAMALVPRPRCIIRCLLTDYMDEQDHGESQPAGNNAECMKKILDSEAEQSLCCPITLAIMKDPVIAADGHTYERTAIEEWIREKRTSPVTRQPMTCDTLIPNLTVKHLIDQFADMDCND